MWSDAVVGAALSHHTGQAFDATDNGNEYAPFVLAKWRHWTSGFWIAQLNTRFMASKIRIDWLVGVTIGLLIKHLLKEQHWVFLLRWMVGHWRLSAATWFQEGKGLRL
jgi:hypothetical protein